MQVGRQLPGDGKGAGFKGYSSTLACLRHLVRTEGLLGLTRGVGATMLRETPGNAIFFLRSAGLSPCAWKKRSTMECSNEALQRMWSVL